MLQHSLRTHPRSFYSRCSNSWTSKTRSVTCTYYLLPNPHISHWHKLINNLCRSFLIPLIAPQSCHTTPCLSLFNICTSILWLICGYIPLKQTACSEWWLGQHQREDGRWCDTNSEHVCMYCFHEGYLNAGNKRQGHQFDPEVSVGCNWKCLHWVTRTDCPVRCEG